MQLMQGKTDWLYEESCDRQKAIQKKMLLAQKEYKEAQQKYKTKMLNLECQKMSNDERQLFFCNHLYDHVSLSSEGDE